MPNYELGEREQAVVSSGDSAGSQRFYKVAGMVLRNTIVRWLRVDARGLEKLDIDGPVILAPVHRSNVDAPILGALTPRRMRSLAKESLFSGRLVTWVMAALGGFPVRRGTADRDALRACRMLLDRGEVLLVFPEGTRQTGNEVGEMFDGPAYLSAKTGAPVVPIGIAGTESAMPPGARFPKRVRAALVVGDPMAPPEKASMKARSAYTAQLKINLQEVFSEAQAIVE